MDISELFPLPVELNAGDNILKIRLPSGSRGLIFISLTVNDRVVQTKKMVAL
jgi:hypothetical protein